MNAKQLLTLGASALASSVSGLAVAEEMQGQYVQVAEIEIDPAQLESYNAAVKEQIETAIGVEPGVLVLFAVSVKDNPTHIRVFEVYQDADAYKSHLEIRAFQEIQGHYGEHGQVAQTCPYYTHHARREGEVRTLCTDAQAWPHSSRQRLFVSVTRAPRL